MTIKEATKTMLWNIETHHTRQMNEKGIRSKDKQIAEMLMITPASYSRLRTGVTEPKIMTWFKIVKLHRLLVGARETDIIMEEIQ